jgi:hypothetical protein
MKDSNLRIGIVGKRLVHYKHFKGQAKRAGLSIVSIPALEKYLEENNAVLTTLEALTPPKAAAASH